MYRDKLWLAGFQLLLEILWLHYSYASALRVLNFFSIEFFIVLVVLVFFKVNMRCNDELIATGKIDLPSSKLMLLIAYKDTY